MPKQFYFKQFILIYESFFVYRQFQVQKQYYFKQFRLA